MNPVLGILINALLKYVQAHPDEIEKLVAVLIQQAIAGLSRQGGQ